MHRLLHGDVGSGKTVVALLGLAAVARAGHQGALLAPTDVLARQHFRVAAALLHRLDVEVAFLAASVPARSRRQVSGRLGAGHPAVVIGTHALLGKTVEIPRLALAVVDEQHRFGVNQRARLLRKGIDADLLVMTATPIPRSLAMTLYGDLDLSVLDECPPGRHPVTTRRVSRRQLPALFREVRRVALEGGRVFVVCPLVEETDKSDLAAANACARRLAAAYGGRPAVALAHGRRSAAENGAALDDFRSGRCPVLVATVVVEVGVDVPEATMMVVLDAQRFGLAALHQLRGRVGRGAGESACVLVGEEEPSRANTRLDVLVEESNGFHIAERDLEMRGAGQLFGFCQHGLFEFSHANLARDVDLIAQARKDARAVVRSGRSLELERWLPWSFADPQVEEKRPGPG